MLEENGITKESDVIKVSDMDGEVKPPKEDVIKTDGAIIIGDNSGQGNYIPDAEDTKEDEIESVNPIILKIERIASELNFVKKEIVQLNLKELKVTSVTIDTSIAFLDLISKQYDSDYDLIDHIADVEVLIKGDPLKGIVALLNNLKMKIFELNMNFATPSIGNVLITQALAYLFNTQIVINRYIEKTKTTISDEQSESKDSIDELLNN